VPGVVKLKETTSSSNAATTLHSLPMDRRPSETQMQLRELPASGLRETERECGAMAEGRRRERETRVKKRSRSSWEDMWGCGHARARTKGKIGAMAMILFGRDHRADRTPRRPRHSSRSMELSNLPHWTAPGEDEGTASSTAAVMRIAPLTWGVWRGSPLS
jgi:hypothetical protein